MNIRRLAAWLVFLSAFAAAQRLPGNVVPQHYALTFTPDFANNTFAGDETIDVQVLTPTRSIVLNAVEIDFQATTVKAGDKQLPANVVANSDHETVTLQLPSEVGAGPAAVHITYTGHLNDKLRGLYRSEANHRTYAVSQFEAIDARVAFPSFDEPAYKATFDITAVVDKGDTAISNGQIVSDEPAENGKHRIRFSTTPKMSSYLVALTVGDWKCISGEQDGVQLRICAIPGREQQGKFALEATKSILHFYNQYFGIKYPYGKLDQIAVPDFSAGAMENTGAIIYRERALLLDETKASVNDEKNVALVIAHEMAHQWFGDLVTMQWWNDIWLNEGFATWMESKPVAAWKPEWEISQDQVLTTNEALDTDSTRNTRPIRQAAEAREEINSLFDGIAYEKTASVLRMLEGYIGDAAFRRGVNRYLAAHQYGNARAEDFWGAMTEASGKPIDKILPTFVTQPGAPYVSVEAKCVNGETTGTLSQKRFYSSPKWMEESSGELWQLPVCMDEIGKEKASSCRLLSARSEPFTLKGCGAGVFPNAAGTGYYRYSFAPETLKSPDFQVTELSPEEQVSLVADEGALLAAGVHHVDDWLAMASKFENVETYGAVSQLVAQLEFVNEYLLDTNDAPKFQVWVRKVFQPTLARLGTTPSAKDTPNQRNTRAKLVELLGNVGEDPKAIALANQVTSAYMEDPKSVDSTLAGASFQVAAAHGNAALYDRFLAKLQTASSPQEFYRYFYALAAFRDPALLERTMEWTLTPAVRNQDLNIMIRVLENPAGQKLAWNFIQQRYGDFVRKAGQSIFGARFAYQAVGKLCDEKSEKEAQQFLDVHKVAGLERVEHRQMERLGQCVDLRKREEPQLAKYFEKGSTATAGQQ